MSNVPVPVPGPIWEPTHKLFEVRVANAIGAALRCVGLRVPRLDAQSMLRAARLRTGLSDFGDSQFREGLEVLVAAFESRNVAHTFGRFFFREYCIRLLCARLMVQRSLVQHPEILDVPVTRPIIITGLPRSGTTLLHRLMSEDPAARSLRTWETMEPAPPPTTETYLTDPRIARTRRKIALLNRLGPDLALAHHFDAEMPEECNDFFAQEFRAAIFGFMFDVPDYVRWAENQAALEPYRYLKRILQLLSWKCPPAPPGGGRWVLKAPAHIYALDTVLAVFPDACIIQTHRDPLEVMPSLCSLTAMFRGMVADRVDLRFLGSELTEALAVGPKRAIAVRATADPARFFDVDYRALLADPIGTVRDALEYFGDEFAPEYEAKAQRWLAENPQNKRGVHRYRLEDFGLDAATVNERFAEFNEWVASRVRPVVAL